MIRWCWLSNVKLTVACVLLGAALITFSPMFVASADTEDMFAELRQRRVVFLTGGPNVDRNDRDLSAKIESVTETAQKYWDLLVPLDDPRRNAILFADKPSTATSGHVVNSFERLRDMAIAYATEGSSLKGNEALKEAILGGYDWMYAHQYNETVVTPDNWFHWQISGPRAFLDGLMIMYPYLTETQRDNFTKAVAWFSPDPNLVDAGPTTGANRAQKAFVVMLNAILSKDKELLEHAIAAITDSSTLPSATWGTHNLFDYADTPGQDGMHRDGTFLQHGAHPQLGSYGVQYLQLFPEVYDLVSGTSVDIQHPSAENVYRWIYNSYAPAIYKGSMTDLFRGRNIANGTTGSHVVGHWVIEAVIAMARHAPAEDAMVFKSMVKAWVTQDTYRNFLATAKLYHANLVNQWMDDPSIPVYQASYNKIYTQGDRVIHHRPDFSFAIAMSSSRVFRYESINRNNVRGWHTGAGKTYLFNGDLGHYDDHYWPTADMYRLPGTTVTTRRYNDAEGQSSYNPHDWVGGSTNGEFASIGMRYTPQGTDLTATKSWFLLDDMVVALGAGINEGTGEHAVETIVENRMIDSDKGSKFTVDGQKQDPSLISDVQNYSNVGWVHLQGRTIGSDIGYIFPDRPSLNAVRETRTGNWSDIWTGPSNVSASYQTLWLNHGIRPQDEAYSYAILPNATAAETETYAANPAFRILHNTKELQAVSKEELGYVGANFWSNTRQAVLVNSEPWITTSAPSSVVTMLGADELEVTVADPTQRQTEPFEVEIHHSASGILDMDPRLTVTQLEPTVKLRVDPKGALGVSMKVVLRLTNPPDSSAPSAPDLIKAEPLSPISIRLQWEDPQEETGIRTYRVYRDGEIRAELLSRTFVDTGLSAGTRYEYRVEAVDSAGNRSERSGAAEITTLTGFETFPVDDDFEDIQVGETPFGYITSGNQETVAVALQPDGLGQALKLNGAGQTVSKPFPTQASKSIIAFQTVIEDVYGEGAWAVQEGEQTVLRLTAKNGYFSYSDDEGKEHYLQAYDPMQSYAIHLSIDPDAQTCNILIDGIRRATSVPFLTPVNGIDRLSVESRTNLAVYMDNLKVAPLTYSAYETFDELETGTTPNSFNVRKYIGDVSVVEFPGSGDKSLRMLDDSTKQMMEISKIFPQRNEAMRWSMRVMLTKEGDNLAFKLSDKNGTTILWMLAENGEFRFKTQGGRNIPLQPYQLQRWYDIEVVVDPETDRATVYIDGIERGKDLVMYRTTSHWFGTYVTTGGPTDPTQMPQLAENYVSELFAIPDRLLGLRGSIHAPTADNLTIDAALGEIVELSAQDFTSNYSGYRGAELEAVRIKELPAKGTLLLNDAPVTLFQLIPVAETDQLAFVPDDDWSGIDAFRWEGVSGEHMSNEAGLFITVKAGSDSRFSDVPITHPAYEAIEALSSHNALADVNDTFRPEKEATEVFFVSMLVRIFEFDGVKEVPAFFEPAEYGDFTADVERAYRAGLIQGRFHAEDSLTVAEAVRYLRMVERVLEGKTKEQTEIMENNEESTDRLVNVESLVNTQVHPQTVLTRSEAAQAVYKLLVSIE